MHVLAHVLSGNVIPEPAQWTAVGLIALGGLGVLRRRTRAVDAVSWATFTVGGVACLVMVGVGMLAPVPPAYSLSLAMNSTRTSPVLMTACAKQPDGTATKTPDRDHVLAVLIDGVQVATESSSTFAVTVPPGTHKLRVELLTRDHREFTPPLRVDTTISVVGEAAPSGWPVCTGG